jgi:hypothetical protein
VAPIIRHSPEEGLQTNLGGCNLVWLCLGQIEISPKLT